MPPDATDRDRVITSAPLVASIRVESRGVWDDLRLFEYVPGAGVEEIG